VRGRQRPIRGTSVGSTPCLNRTPSRQPTENELEGAAARNLPSPRISQPEEITRLVLFVASDEARFSTGSEFLPDAGHLLG